MNPINAPVVNGFQEFTGVDSTISGGIRPKYAADACLSEARKALWTNRVPQQEPWPRVLMVDETQDEKSDEHTKNVHHVPQFTNEGEAGRKPIGRVEGDEDIPRGDLWRR